jgi:biopolymer transport protein ExbD
MKAQYKMKKAEKINLVPILDSVFIFIFFLLMSAQFVDVYEIGSSLPMTQEVKEKEMDKDPLNLTLEIGRDRVVVKTGLKNVESKSFKLEEEKPIKDYLISLKRKNPKENTMIIKSDAKVSFQNLVKVIDHTRAEKDSKEKLFEEIVFDNKAAL